MTADRHAQDPQTGIMDGLRTLRYVARQVRRHTKAFGPDRVLPEPFSRPARSMLEQVDGVTTMIGQQTEDVLRRVLKGGHGPAQSLDTLVKDRNAVEAFSRTVYGGLRTALGQLGAEEALVLESAAQQAFRATLAEMTPDQEAFAARLYAHLMAKRVVRDVADSDTTTAPARDIPAIAVFAVVLWLICDRDATEDDDLIHACTSLALGLRDDIIAAGHDTAPLSRLFAEFRHHV